MSKVEKDGVSDVMDAQPPAYNEALFEDPALSLEEIQQAFDKAGR